MPKYLYLNRALYIKVQYRYNTHEYSYLATANRAFRSVKTLEMRADLQLLLVQEVRECS